MKPVNKIMSFNEEGMKEFVKEGIDNLLKKHDMNDYQLKKASGFSGVVSIQAIRKSGAVEMKTLYRIGCGLGYKGTHSAVIRKVLNDFNPPKAGK